MKKKRIILFPLLLCMLTASAQDVPTYSSVQSASGMGTYVSNDLYDGSANVAVPFYNTSVDGIPIDISLSYNTKGIRVDQVASCAGLGWLLNSGSSITRILHDFPDEVYVPKLHVFPSATSSLYEQACIGSWYNPPVLSATLDIFTRYNLAHNDDELDEFVATLNGKKISFFISKTGTVLTIPKTDIKIQRIINGTAVGNNALPDPTGGSTTSVNFPQQWNLEFIITDEVGNKYHFIKGDAHTLPYIQLYQGNIQDGGFSSPTGQYYHHRYEIADRWVIKDIETSRGKTITFDYNKKDVEYDLSESQLFIEPQISSLHPDMSYKTELHKSTGYISYISKIKINSANTIDFTYSDRIDLPNTKALTKISISTIHGGISGGQVIEKNKQVSNYNLNYKYFHSPDDITTDTELPFNTTFSGNKRNVRLKLANIESDFGNNNSKTLFEFTYHSVPLPARLSLSQDLYGYYNAATPQTHSDYPNFKSSVYLHPFFGTAQYIGVSKAANFEFAQAWCLTGVKNEKGAETKFTYGGHSGLSIPNGINAPSEVVTTATGDGLLLVAQTDTDPFVPENDVQTIYNYSNGEYFLPGGKIFQPFNTRTSNGADWWWNVYSNTFTSANMLVNGSNHGYGKVTLIKRKRYATGANAGQFGAVLNYTEYEFSNATTNLSGFTNLTTNLLSPSNTNSHPSNYYFTSYFKAPFSNKHYYRDWAMGLPIRTTIKDVNGKTNTVTECHYSFTDNYLSSSDFMSMGTQLINHWESGEVIELARDYYYPSTGKATLDYVEKKDYVSDNSYKYTKEENTYDSHNNIIKTAVKSGDGNILETRNYYSYDWIGNSAASPAVNQLNSESYQYQILSETWKTSAANPSDKKIISAELNGISLINSKPFPVYKYQLLTTNGIQQSTYQSGGPSSINLYNTSQGQAIPNFKLVSTNTDFDVYGNLREVKNNDADYYCASFFDGLNGKVIANVKNAKISECAFTSFDGFYADYGTNDQNKGNWDFNPIYIKSATAENTLKVSGSLIYLLKANSNDNKIVSNNISFISGSSYIISFWAKNGVPVVKNGSTYLTAQPYQAGVGGWTLYKIKFTPTINNISVETNTSDMYIDELRMYPVGAQMSTSTFEPQFGMSATCNANDGFIRYEYDEWGRKTVVRDQLNRIISKTKYVINGND